jgi:hypothetical protein
MICSSNIATSSLLRLLSAAVTTMLGPLLFVWAARSIRGDAQRATYSPAPPTAFAGNLPDTATKPFWGTHETILKQTRDNSVANNAAARHAKGAQMNHSFHSADRSTHLKIVVLALVAGIVVAGFGISARTNSDYTQTAHVVKAGKLMTVTSSANSMVR